MNRHIRFGLRLGLGLAVVFLLSAAPARAQEEGDIDLIKSQSGAPPNLLILFDTSENMRHVVWSSEFNPVLFYDGTGAAKFCDNLTVPARVGTDGDCPEGNGPNGKCPDNSGPGNYRLAGEQVRCRKNDFSSTLCAGWTIGACSVVSSDIYFTLPNYALPPYTARWSKNYLAFLVNYYSSKKFLPPDLPQETRLVTARQAIKDVIEAVNPTRTNGTSEDNVRFGLARPDTDFVNLLQEPVPIPPLPDSDTHADPLNDGHGGYIVVPPAAGNKAQLFQALDDFVPIDYVPLSEAMVDIGRFFVGDHIMPDKTQGLGEYPIYDRDTKTGATTATPPKSPIDPKVGCQKNFVVIVTSGDPESDENDEFNGNSVFTATFTNDYDNDKMDPGPIHTRDFLDDITLYMHSQRVDESDVNSPWEDRDLVIDDVMPKAQNITTYVIGFSFRSDLLQRSGVKGGGGYFTTHTRAGLVDTLVTAIDDILLRSATFTAATVPTSRQSFGDAFFVTFLEPRPEGDLWVGHLQAFKLDENFEIVGPNGPAIDPTTGQFFEPRAPFWDTQTELHDPNQVRNLLVTKTPSRAFTAANMTATDLGVVSTDLTQYPNDPSVPFTTTENLADAIVNWVHGRDTFDKDRDLNSTELREAVLGDIFHSNPLAIAAPPPFLSGEPGFGPPGNLTSFYEKYANRLRVIYAGANDGMLHGIHAGKLVIGDDPSTTQTTETEYYEIGTGDELFGYVPKFLLPNIKLLPQRRDKTFYVDGTPSVADVWLPSSAGDTVKDPSEWATSLVVGSRNGADGYLALDVTDPNATSLPHGPYPKLLWEFSDPNEALGRTWSEPVITRVKMSPGVNGDFCGVNNGEGTGTSYPNGNCRELWVAIFGGGFREAANPNQATYVTDPNNPTWSDDSKSIYIVRMDTGAVLAKAVYSASDPQLREMRYAIPSQPAVVDLNFDGFADLIYVGDLGGQIWKWNISALGTTNTSGLVPLSTWPIVRLFAAPRAINGHYRSLFSPPSVSLVNSQVTLAFGTGERTDIQYATTPTVDENRFYVMKDPNALAPGLPTAPYTELNLTNLSGLPTDPNPTDLGYYLVGSTDEKFVTDPVTFGGFVIATSYTPDQANSAANCTARGNATLYIFSVVDGKGFYASATVDGTRRLSIGGGLPTSPTVVQANMTDTRIIVQTSDGRVLTPGGPKAPQNGSQIIFWREVF